MKELHQEDIRNGLVELFKEISLSLKTRDYIYLFRESKNEEYENYRKKGNSKLISKIKALYQAFSQDWVFTKLRLTRTTRYHTY